MKFRLFYILTILKLGGFYWKVHKNKFNTI